MFTILNSISLLYINFIRVPYCKVMNLILNKPKSFEHNLFRLAKMGATASTLSGGNGISFLVG